MCQFREFKNLTSHSVSGSEHSFVIGCWFSASYYRLWHSNDLLLITRLNLASIEVEGVGKECLNFSFVSAGIITSRTELLVAFV